MKRLQPRQPCFSRHFSSLGMSLVRKFILAVDDSSKEESQGLSSDCVKDWSLCCHDMLCASKAAEKEQEEQEALGKSSCFGTFLVRGVAFLHFYSEPALLR